MTSTDRTDGKDNDTSFLAGPMIQVIVSLDDLSKTFYVHRDLITSRSLFFAKALKTYADGDGGNVQWAEGESEVVKLPEDSPAIFTHYLQVLYYDKAPVRKAVQDKRETKEAYEAFVDDFETEYNDLADLYVFCEKILDTRAKAVVLTACMKATCIERLHVRYCYPGFELIKKVYEGTMNGDPLRSFLVDSYAFSATKSWFSDATEEGSSPKFFIDLAIKLTTIKEGSEKVSRITDAEKYCKMLWETDAKSGGLDDS